MTLKCGISGCPAQYNNASSFKSHLQRTDHLLLTESACPSSPHQDNLGYDNDGNDTTQGELHSLDSSVHDNCEGESDSRSNRMQSTALFILKLRELKSLTQNTIDSLVVDVKEQIDAAIEEHSAATRTLLNKAGIDIA